LDLDYEYTLNILQYEFKNPYFSYNFFEILLAKHLWHPIFGLTYIPKTTHSDPPEGSLARNPKVKDLDDCGAQN
jgi:hypothetical protein